LLFLGPTDPGKHRVVGATAESLLVDVTDTARGVFAGGGYRFRIWISAIEACLSNLMATGQMLEVVNPLLVDLAVIN
jgi:hypothetical protein